MYLDHEFGRKIQSKYSNRPKWQECSEIDLELLSLRILFGGNNERKKKFAQCTHSLSIMKWNGKLSLFP